MNELMRKLLQPWLLFAFWADDPDGGGDGEDDDKAADRGDGLDDPDGEDNPDGKKDSDDPDADDADGKKDADDTDDKKDDAKPPMIPKTRFDEALAKERAKTEAALAELSKYQSSAAATEVADKLEKDEAKLEELEAAYTKQLADGELDKAAATMRSIRHTEREINMQQVAIQTQAAEERAVEMARYDVVVERLEKAYPVLNPDAEEYDEDATNSILSFYGILVRGGMKPSAALQKAVKSELGAADSDQKRATDVTPRVNERVAAQRKKNVDAAARQPANLARAGMDSDKAGGGPRDLFKLSEEEFDKLADKDLAKARGDFI